MQDETLTSQERASLISLARIMYDRASKVPAASVTTVAEGGPDIFSLEALRGRVADLEERLQSTHRAWTSNLNTILFALERSEARLSIVGGEMDAFRETVLWLEMGAERHKQEVLQASQVLVEQLSERMAAIMDRLEATAQRGGGDRSPADAGRDPSTP